MSALAAGAPERVETAALVRALLLVTCAAAFFVLAYTPGTSWAAIRGGAAEGFRDQFEAMERAHEFGNPYRQAAGVALGLLGVAGLASRRGERLRVRGATGWAVVAYVAWSFASVGWSDDPAVSLRRGAAFALMLIAVASVVRLLPASGVVAFALLASGAYVVVAAAVELSAGALRPLAPEYRFSGIFHPNPLGAFCAVLVIAATCAGRLRVPRWLVGAALVVGSAGLLLTRSRSALVGLAAALAVRWVVAARRSSAVLAIAAAAWVACALPLVAPDGLGPALREASGAARPDSRFETLSGRTLLWDELLGYAAERPVVGWGLGAFWDVRRFDALYRSQRWPVADAHSTYLQQLLDVGGVGLALYVLVVAGAAHRAGRRLRETGDGAYAFMLALAVYFAVAGVVETLQPPPSFLTFLFFWSVAFLALREAPPSDGESPCAST